MKILAVDTTADLCSAALRLDDGELHSRCGSEPRGHTRHLLPMVREVSEAAGIPLSDLDALAFGRGPGSFTGLRIATGAVQGLAWALEKPVVPVSSLAAVAARAVREYQLAVGTGIAVAFDARMGEVYWGCFRLDESGLTPVGGEAVLPPGDVALPDCSVTQWFGAGSGWTLSEQFPESVCGRVASVDETLSPLARDIAELAVRAAENGEGVEPERARPVYLRDDVAWKKSR